MSGHSKWNNIKNKKEKTDAQKAKIFTKMGREIAVAAKTGGANPESNSRLKDAIAKARSYNMPNDNIARVIAKAAGEQNMDNFEDVVYEGYGPNGVAVIVETLTDNKNRTAADMRHYFDKFGGNLGTSGCVMFMFDKKGQIIVAKEDYEAELGSKPLGEFVREIVGLDMRAAKEAFAEYLNKTKFDSRQIYFVNQVVEYIVRNGLMKDLTVLQETPFTDYGSIVDIFQDVNVWFNIREIIESINANARVA